MSVCYNSANDNKAHKKRVSAGTPQLQRMRSQPHRKAATEDPQNHLSVADTQHLNSESLPLAHPMHPVSTMLGILELGSHLGVDLKLRTVARYPPNILLPQLCVCLHMQCTQGKNTHE
eukprot:3516976-Amphidinium_carterae.1